MLLRFGEGNAFRHMVPLLQATATATSAGVLCNEDGVAPHRRLFAVARDQGGGEALANKILRVDAEGFRFNLLNIRFILFGEVEF